MLTFGFGPAAEPHLGEHDVQLGHRKSPIFTMPGLLTPIGCFAAEKRYIYLGTRKGSVCVLRLSAAR